MSILVMGGSQGARILSDVVPEAIANLPAKLRQYLRVFHQARKEDHNRVEVFYAIHQIDAVVKSFFSNVPTLMSEAQLVISRAGASSVADIAVIGRPSILIPYAAATGDHQTANARGLVDGDAAIMIPESKLDVQTLTDQMFAILDNPNAANQMAQAALNCGRPDATDRLVEMVETLADVENHNDTGPKT